MTWEVIEFIITSDGVYVSLPPADCRSLEHSHYKQVLDILQDKEGKRPPTEKFNLLGKLGWEMCETIQFQGDTSFYFKKCIPEVVTWEYMTVNFSTNVCKCPLANNVSTVYSREFDRFGHTQASKLRYLGVMGWEAWEIDEHGVYHFKRETGGGSKK